MLDWLIQQAVAQVLGPLFEADFSEHSHGYYKLSSTYKEVLALSVWIRRRVRLYYWKQARTRRRHLLALGADHSRGPDSD